MCTRRSGVTKDKQKERRSVILIRFCVVCRRWSHLTCLTALGWAAWDNPTAALQCRLYLHLGVWSPAPISTYRQTPRSHVPDAALAYSRH
jgi:hypothetical protein